MSSVLPILLALLEAVPTLKSWWDELVALYVNTQIDKMKKENVDAIRKAFEEHDQRKLEEAAGMAPGAPSGLPGVVIRPPRDHNIE